MSGTATASFVGFVKQDGVERLTGGRARQPLLAGQTIVAHGTHEDGSATGPGIFLVLRQSSARDYLMAPLGSSDGYWQSYLAELPTVKAMLWRDSQEAMQEGKELLVCWRVASDVGEVPNAKDYGEFKKPLVKDLAKKWHFLNELVVSEKPPPQAATVPHFARKP